MNYTLSQLEGFADFIPWRQPLPVQWPGITMFVCRVCMANRGLKRDSAHQWQSYDEARDHIEVSHS